MRKWYILGALGALSLTAAPTLAERVLSLEARTAKVEVSSSVAQKVTRPANAETAKLDKKGFITVTSRNGVAVKQVNKALLPNRSLKHQGAKSSVAKEAPQGSSLYESFEGYDGTEGWLPAGWSIDTANPDRDPIEKWNVTLGIDNPFMPSPSQGDAYAMVCFSMDAQDEWLIAPAVDVTEGQTLSFYMTDDPLWYYSLDEGMVDWDTMEWISQETICTVQVMAREEGSDDWTMLRDFATEHIGESLSDLMTSSSGELEEQIIDISAYAGKKVQFAVRYFGANGNTICLDEMAVSLPALDVCYANPLNSLYFGTDKSSDMSYLNLPMAVYPVYEELTWMNTSDELPGANFTWNYCDPQTSEWAQTDDEVLSVSYAPDFSSEFTRRNNLYYFPVLEGSAPGASAGQYTDNVKYLQAGGAPDFEVNNGDGATVEHFGLLPFNIVNDGMIIGTADAEEFGGDYGDPAIPVFGYDKNVRKFWTNYTFQGEEEEGDYAEINAIINFFYPGEQPLVVKGLWVNAKGQIGDNATFKAEIYPLDEEFEPLETPMAVATIKGSDVLVTEGGSQNFLCLPFEFEQPVTLTATESQAYIFKVSGFKDAENVTYFAPYQSYIPNKDELAFGWVEKEISFAGEVHTSFSPVCYLDFGLGDAYNSFAINVDGYYPYLTSEEDSMEAVRYEDAYLPLASYYDGAELSVETDLTAGHSVVAEVTGRYDEAKLHILDNCECNSLNHDFNVTISAPGVKKVISVISATSGINDIETDMSEVVEMYDLAGRKVNSDAESGIYLVRKASGQVEKIRK